ncbi:MAG: hypothetical protein WBB18_17920 [Nodosilinea sp.]
MKTQDSSVAIALHGLDLLATTAAIIAAALVMGSNSRLVAVEQTEATFRLKARLCPARSVANSFRGRAIGRLL